VTTWDDLSDRARELMIEYSELDRAQMLADIEAKMTTLHAGEEPYDNELVVPTPAQWIWQWNRATVERRLEVVAAMQEAVERADLCRWEHSQLREQCDYYREQHEKAQARLAAARAVATEAARNGAVRDGNEQQTDCPAWCADGHMYDGSCRIDPALDGVIGESRDLQHPGWYWSCEGVDGACFGWLSLDHPTAAAARRSYDRHVRRKHAELPSVTCCICGTARSGRQAFYENYRGDLFCPPCADGNRPT
jgi:hypothetical protein